MMAKSAPFQAADKEIWDRQTYSPVPIPPRGEIVAWLFTLMLAGLSALLVWQAGMLPFWAPLFTILALLLALSIRFSRWLESHTTISMSPEGIIFSSPIRKHAFHWDEIRKLVADPAGNGWRIYILGERGTFRFQTETTMRGLRGTEVRTGYPGGAEIVKQTLRMAEMGEAESEGSSWTWERS